MGCQPRTDEHGQNYDLRRWEKYSQSFFSPIFPRSRAAKQKRRGKKVFSPSRKTHFTQLRPCSLDLRVNFPPFCIFHRKADKIAQVDSGKMCSFSELSAQSLHDSFSDFFIAIVQCVSVNIRRDTVDRMKAWITSISVSYVYTCPRLRGS